MGSCSSFESKYRYRDARRTCPACGGAFIIKGREEYGGGWLCHRKAGGCGAKFEDHAEVITAQTVGRVDNPDIVDTKNTVLKMAKKRAKVDAIIGVTRSSGIFTQDIEEVQRQEATRPASGTSAAQAPTAQAPAAQAPAAQATKPAQAQATQVQGGPPVEDGDPGPAGVGAVAKPAQAQGQTVQFPRPVPPPAAKTAPQQAPQQTSAAATGGSAVRIKELDVRSGESAKGPWKLYIVRFETPAIVDGKQVKDASTFEENVAMAAENARAAGKLVIPVVVPAKRKGSYELKGLEYPVE